MTAADAVRSADWSALMPNLVAFARRRLRRCGWGETRESVASVVTAEELVARAIEYALDGSRVWDPAAVDFAGFMRGTIRSLASSTRKQVVRQRTVPSGELAERRAAPPECWPDVRVCAEEEERDVTSLLARAAAGSDRLFDLVDAVIDGATSRDARLDAGGGLLGAHQAPSSARASRTVALRRRRCAPVSRSACGRSCVSGSTASARRSREYFSRSRSRACSSRGARAARTAPCRTSCTMRGARSRLDVATRGWCPSLREAEASTGNGARRRAARRASPPFVSQPSVPRARSRALRGSRSSLSTPPRGARVSLSSREPSK